MNKNEFFNNVKMFLKNIYTEILFVVQRITSYFKSDEFKNLVKIISEKAIVFTKKIYGKTTESTKYIAIHFKPFSRNFFRWIKIKTIYLRRHFKPILLKIISAVIYFGFRVYRFIKRLFRKKTGTPGEEIHQLKIKINIFGFFGFISRNYRRLFELSLRKPAFYYSAAIFVNLLLVFLILNRVVTSKHYWDGEEVKKISVKRGQNFDEILNTLKDNNVIGNKFIFKIIIKIRGGADKINIGLYTVNNGVSYSELAGILTSKPPMIKFTVPEGYTIKQISRIAESKANLIPEKFIKETENDSLINVLGLKGKIKNLEGFLFPATYFLPGDIEEKELVVMMFSEFQKKVIKDPNFSKLLSEKKKSLFNVVIMASIVQAETPVIEEMPLIAGVYFNRLKKGMKLQADPTVQYVIPNGPKRLMISDLKFESPYNTYMHTGLPPGPIGNPGYTALVSTLNPKQTNYLFFVATGTGGHKFSETYEQHLKAKEEFNKKRNQNK